MSRFVKIGDDGLRVEERENGDAVIRDADSAIMVPARLRRACAAALLGDLDPADVWTRARAVHGVGHPPSFDELSAIDQEMRYDAAHADIEEARFLLFGDAGLGLETDDFIFGRPDEEDGG